MFNQVSDYNGEEIVEFDVGTSKLEILCSDACFRPNSTSKFIFQSIPDLKKGHVLDLGCGVGVLAIACVTSGFQTATGIDSHEISVSMAQRNAVALGVAGRCNFVVGDATRLSIDLSRFDLIICDTSGMSSNISRASSWYPSGVPLADSSGIDVISAVLKQVASDTSFEGKIMFPVLSLSRRKDLVREAAQLFPYSLKRQFRRWLPLPSNSDLQATLTTAVVAGNAEVSKRGSRYVWCLDIYEATPIFDREVRAQARLWTKPNICIKKLPPRQIGDGFTIRHATEADLKSLFKIRCEVFSGEQQRTFCLDEQAQIYTDHQDRFAENFVALDASGAIIGGIRMSMPSAGSVILPSRYAHLVSKLSPEADWAVLDRGCLKQGCRGGRLYRQMYQFVADFATSNNVKLLVGAIDRDNKALHAFHERMGWHVDPCEMPSTEYGLVSIVAKLLP